MICYDNRACELGEGAFWHPEEGRFYWFDILNRRLLAGGGGAWQFDRMASAAGRIDANRLLIATETGLAVFDLRDGSLSHHISVEADQPLTRSNDGRADRQGGFWFGTMGKQAKPGAGSIYRYYRGRVERLVEGISIPNAISFTPDGHTAFYADTATGIVMRQPLDADGWPSGAPVTFLDLAPEGLNPDGATFDREGGLWIAKWGAGAVMRYAPDGSRTHQMPVGGRHSSCPAFGGVDLSEMLVTTAREGIEAPDAAQGTPWLIRPGFRGLPEPEVIL